MPVPGLGNRRLDAVSGGGTWAVYFQKAFPGMAGVENHRSRVVVFQSIVPPSAASASSGNPLQNRFLDPTQPPELYQKLQR